MVRVVSVVAVLTLGCAPIDAADCDRHKSKGACERAEAELGECMWLEVRAPAVVDGACEPDPPTHGECVGISADTNAGCGVVDCGGGEAQPTFFQTVDDRVEVLVSPRCGGNGVVSGEWQDCSETTAPAECGCACAP